MTVFKVWVKTNKDANVWINVAAIDKVDAETQAHKEWQHYKDLYKDEIKEIKGLTNLGELDTMVKSYLESDN